jgi:hypothetical protein
VTRVGTPRSGGADYTAPPDRNVPILCDEHYLFSVVSTRAPFSRPHILPLPSSAPVSFPVPVQLIISDAVVAAVNLIVPRMLAGVVAALLAMNVGSASLHNSLPLTPSNEVHSSSYPAHWLAKLVSL